MVISLNFLGDGEVIAGGFRAAWRSLKLNDTVFSVTIIAKPLSLDYIVFHYLSLFGIGW